MRAASTISSVATTDTEDGTRQKSEAGTRLNTNIFMLYFRQEATGALATASDDPKLTPSSDCAAERFQPPLTGIIGDAQTVRQRVFDHSLSFNLS